MEETQVMNFDETFDRSDIEDETPIIIGWMEIDNRRHELKEGTIKVGRDPSTCKIVIGNEKTVSKEHAVLEVDKTCVTLMDLGSRNKTRIGKMMLKPNVRYALQGGERIRFGAVQGTFITNEKFHDSDSDLCSDSVLNEETPSKRKGCNESSDNSVISPTPQISTKNITSPKTVNESIEENQMSDNSLLISPTPISKTPLVKQGFCSKASLVIPETPAHCSRLNESPFSQGVISQSTPFTSYAKSLKSFTPPAFFSPISDNGGKDLKMISLEDCTKAEDCVVKSIFNVSQNPKEGNESYNTDESTDSEEDFLAPEKTKKNTKDDITTMATQPFVKEDEISKVGDEGDDDTQDILKAFNDNESVEPDNTQDVLEAFEECTQKPEVGIISEAATQQFDKTNSGTMFKRPFVCTLKTNKANKEKTEEKCFDIFDAPTQVFIPDGKECKDDDKSNNVDIFDMPTQIFERDSCINNIRTEKPKRDIFEAPTQVFEAPTQVFEAPTQVFEAPTQVFEAPTQVFEAPTQVFHPSKDVMSISEKKYGTVTSDNSNSSKTVDLSSGHSSRDFNLPESEKNKDISDKDQPGLENPSKSGDSLSDDEDMRETVPFSYTTFMGNEDFDATQKDDDVTESYEDIPVHTVLDKRVSKNEEKVDLSNDDNIDGDDTDSVASENLLPEESDIHDGNLEVPQKFSCDNIPESSKVTFDKTNENSDEEGSIASETLLQEDQIRDEDLEPTQKFSYSLISEKKAKSSKLDSSLNKNGEELSVIDSADSKKLHNTDEDVQHLHDKASSNCSKYAKVDDKTNEDSDEEVSNASETLLQDDFIHDEDLEPTQKFSYSLILENDKSSILNSNSVKNGKEFSVKDSADSRKLYNSDGKISLHDKTSSDYSENKKVGCDKTREGNEESDNAAETLLQDDHIRDENLEPTQKFSYSLISENKDKGSKTDLNSSKHRKELSENDSTDSKKRISDADTRNVHEKADSSNGYNTDESTDVEEEEIPLGVDFEVNKIEVISEDKYNDEQETKPPAASRKKQVHAESLEPTQKFLNSPTISGKSEKFTDVNNTYSEDQRKDFAKAKMSSRENLDENKSNTDRKTNSANKSVNVEDNEVNVSVVSDTSKKEEKTSELNQNFVNSSSESVEATENNDFLKGPDKPISSDVNGLNDSVLKNIKSDSLIEFNGDKDTNINNLLNTSVNKIDEGLSTRSFSKNVTDDGDLSKLELTGDSLSLSVKKKPNDQEIQMEDTTPNNNPKTDSNEAASVNTSEFTYSCLEIDWSGVPSEESMSPIKSKKKNIDCETTPDKNPVRDGNESFDDDDDDMTYEETNTTGKSQALFDLPSDSDVELVEDDDINSPTVKHKVNKFNEQNILPSSSLKRSKRKYNELNSNSSITKCLEKDMAAKTEQCSEMGTKALTVDSMSECNSNNSEGSVKTRASRISIRNRNKSKYARVEKDDFEVHKGKDDKSNILKINLENLDKKVTRGNCRAIATDELQKETVSENTKLNSLYEESLNPKSSSTPVKFDTTSMGERRPKLNSKTKTIFSKENLSKTTVLESKVYCDSSSKDSRIEDKHVKNKNITNINQPTILYESKEVDIPKSGCTTRRGRKSAAPSRYSPSKVENIVSKKKDNAICKMEKDKSLCLSNERGNVAVNISKKSNIVKRSIENIGSSSDLTLETKSPCESNKKNKTRHSKSDSVSSLFSKPNNSEPNESSKELFKSDKNSSANKTKLTEEIKLTAITRSTRGSSKLPIDNASNSSMKSDTDIGNSKSCSNIDRSDTFSYKSMTTNNSEPNESSKEVFKSDKNSSASKTKITEKIKLTAITRSTRGSSKLPIDDASNSSIKSDTDIGNSKSCSNIDRSDTFSYKSMTTRKSEKDSGKEQGDKNLNAFEVTTLNDKGHCNMIKSESSPSKKDSKSEIASHSTRSKKSNNDSSLNSEPNIRKSRRNVKSEINTKESDVTEVELKVKSRSSKASNKVSEVVKSVSEVDNNLSLETCIKSTRRTTRHSQLDKNEPSKSDDTMSLCSISSDTSFREPVKRKTRGNQVTQQDEVQPVRKSRRTNRFNIENEVELNTIREYSSSEDSQISVTTPKSRRSQIKHKKSPSPAKSTRSKRSRTDSPSFTDEQVLWSPRQRQAFADKHPRVLFTTFKDTKDEKIVKDAGGKIAESASDCTVLVTNAVKRTCKLLACVGKGIPIVSTQWLVATKRARCFVDPWEFIVSDVEAENKFDFTMESSLKIAAKKKLFSGYSIHVTNSVKPPPNDMREIIECAGGEYLEMPPKFAAPKSIIVSCDEDKKNWSSFKKLKLTIVDKEFILTGLLRQKIMLDEFKV
ncbi:UNVERIFIED_CONTAM: hypothetical protein RMT77_004112 [Armadillidium vulgare]